MNNEMARATSRLFKRDIEHIKPIIKKMNENFNSVTTEEMFTVRECLNSFKVYSEMFDEDLAAKEPQRKRRFFNRK